MFDIRKVLGALNDAHVDYVVVGGFAVILHGHLRATADLDLAVGLDPDNATRAMAALASVGLVPAFPVHSKDFADEGIRRVWKEQRNVIVFPMWNPDDPMQSVDIFIDEPVRFDALLSDAVATEIQGVSVPVASIAHLIEMKTISGRPRDLLDIEQLRKLSRAAREDEHGG